MELPKAKKKKKQKHLEYMSKMALFRIIHESSIKKTEREGEIFQKEEQAKKSKESFEFSQERKEELEEENDLVKQEIKKFGRHICEEIDRMERVVDENVNAFGKQNLINIDDELQEEFLV